MNDANVVCRQLRLGGPTSFKIAGYYGAGAGPVWLSSVSCSGSEATLESCSHGSWGAQICSHEEDAGVVCGTSSTPILQLFDYRPS